MILLNRRSVIGGLSIGGFFAPSVRAQGVDLVIQVNLPADRTRAGSLTLKRTDGAVLTNDLPALGKADNAEAAIRGNPDRNPTLPFGDTPEGSYTVPRIVDTGSGSPYSDHSYGPHAAIVLAPASGEASIAAANGRRGLLIHGGSLGSNGRLRATHGCIRLSNEHMLTLLKAISDAGNNPRLQMCEVVRLSVLVGEESDEGAGSDESDPPPGIDELLVPGEMNISLP